MKKQKNKDLYEVIKHFQEHTLSNKPAYEQLVNEVRLMNFKIRPLSGNVASLDFKNEELIEALWCLGKLDEFSKGAILTIGSKDQEAFFRLVNELRWSFQEKLNKVRLAREKPVTEDVPTFEAEIFKENGHIIN